MKIPYIKIYTADLLAKTRRLSPQEIGEAVIAACEMAFEGSTDYKPAQANAQAFFNMLNDWTAESKDALKAQHARAKKGAQARWQKSEVLDGAQAFTKEMQKQSICQCQTETETETETETDIKETKKKSEPEPLLALKKPQTLEDAVFCEFWNAYPKQRAGSKEKARSAFAAALKRHKELNAVQLADKAKQYAKSDEVARGFAKGAQAWLNDDRFLQDYKPARPTGAALEEARERGNAIIQKMFGGEQ